MSGRRQHKLRYNRKLDYIDEFEVWRFREPPMWRFIAWRRWLKAMPRKKRWWK